MDFRATQDGSGAAGHAVPPGQASRYTYPAYGPGDRNTGLDRGAYGVPEGLRGEGAKEPSAYSGVPSLASQVLVPARPSPGRFNQQGPVYQSPYSGRQQAGPGLAGSSGAPQVYQQGGAVQIMPASYLSPALAGSTSPPPNSIMASAPQVGPTSSPAWSGTLSGPHLDSPSSPIWSSPRPGEGPGPQQGQPGNLSTPTRKPLLALPPGSSPSRHAPGAPPSPAPPSSGLSPVSHSAYQAPYPGALVSSPAPLRLPGSGTPGAYQPYMPPHPGVPGSHQVSAGASQPYARPLGPAPQFSGSLGTGQQGHQQPTMGTPGPARHGVMAPPPSPAQGSQHVPRSQTTHVVLTSSVGPTMSPGVRPQLFHSAPPQSTQVSTMAASYATSSATSPLLGPQAPFASGPPASHLAPGLSAGAPRAYQQGVAAPVNPTNQAYRPTQGYQAVPLPADRAPGQGLYPSGGPGAQSQPMPHALTSSPGQHLSYGQTPVPGQHRVGSAGQPGGDAARTRALHATSAPVHPPSTMADSPLKSAPSSGAHRETIQKKTSASLVQPRTSRLQVLKGNTGGLGGVSPAMGPRSVGGEVSVYESPEGKEEGGGKEEPPRQDVLHAIPFDTRKDVLAPASGLDEPELQQHHQHAVPAGTQTTVLDPASGTQPQPASQSAATYQTPVTLRPMVAPAGPPSWSIGTPSSSGAPLVYHTPSSAFPPSFGPASSHETLLPGFVAQQQGRNLKPNEQDQPGMPAVYRTSSAPVSRQGEDSALATGAVHRAYATAGGAMNKRRKRTGLVAVGEGPPGTPTILLPSFFTALPYRHAPGTPLVEHQERFMALQKTLKALEIKDYVDLASALHEMNAVERSEKAASVERRNMALLVEEGREMKRTQRLGILAKRCRAPANKAGIDNKENNGPAHPFSLSGEPSPASLASSDAAVHSGSPGLALGPTKGTSGTPPHEVAQDQALKKRRVGGGADAADSATGTGQAGTGGGPSLMGQWLSLAPTVATSSEPSTSTETPQTPSPPNAPHAGPTADATFAKDPPHVGTAASPSGGTLLVYPSSLASGQAPQQQQGLQRTPQKSPLGKSRPKSGIPGSPAAQPTAEPARALADEASGKAAAVPGGASSGSPPKLMPLEPNASAMATSTPLTRLPSHPGSPSTMLQLGTPASSNPSATSQSPPAAAGPAAGTPSVQPASGSPTTRLQLATPVQLSAGQPLGASPAHGGSPGQAGVVGGTSGLQAEKATGPLTLDVGAPRMGQGAADVLTKAMPLTQSNPTGPLSLELSMGSAPATLAHGRSPLLRVPNALAEKQTNLGMSTWKEE